MVVNRRLGSKNQQPIMKTNEDIGRPIGSDGRNPPIINKKDRAVTDRRSDRSLDLLRVLPEGLIIKRALPSDKSLNFYYRARLSQIIGGLRPFLHKDVFIVGLQGPIKILDFVRATRWRPVFYSLVLLIDRRSDQSLKTSPSILMVVHSF